MRSPIYGVLPPHAVVRITPSPRIDAGEVAALLSPGVKLTEEPGGVILLENPTERPVPYGVVVMRRTAHALGGAIYHQLRAMLAKEKIS